MCDKQHSNDNLTIIEEVMAAILLHCYPVIKTNILEENCRFIFYLEDVST